jgi:hypothetical protein
LTHSSILQKNVDGYSDKQSRKNTWHLGHTSECQWHCGHAKQVFWPNSHGAFQK